MEAALRDLCGRQVPGDTYRNLNVASTYRDQTFKHILAPVWLVSYSYGAQSYQVLVNGVTGTVTGRHPWSWVKIALLVIAALVLLYLYASSR